jgi:hypothetical protein
LHGGGKLNGELKNDDERKEETFSLNAVSFLSKDVTNCTWTYLSLGRWEIFVSMGNNVVLPKGTSVKLNHLSTHFPLLLLLY